MGFPSGICGNEATCQCRRHKIRDGGLILGLGRFLEVENGKPLQYSCLENPMDKGALWVTLPRVSKIQTQLKWLSTHTHTHTHTHTQSKNIPGLFWNSDNGSKLGTAAFLVKRKGTSRKVCVMKGKQLCPPPLSKEGLYFFFNWSIVDLQYYINFRCATQWFSIFIDYTPLKVIMGSALVVQWSGSRTLNSVSCQGNEIPQAALCSQK